MSSVSSSGFQKLSESGRETLYQTTPVLNGPISQQDSQTASWTLPEEKPSKSKKFWRIRKQIPKECKSFFALVKPQNSTKGTRRFLLYVPPFYAIFNSVSEKVAEMEMLPLNTRFYTESRYIVIVQDDKERVFSIKADVDQFHSILNNNETDLTSQFFSCLKLNNGKRVSMEHLTYSYYIRALFMPSFLKVFTVIPVSYLQDDIYEQWIRAAEPDIDSLFEFGFTVYFNEQTGGTYDKFKDFDSFIFTALHTALVNDDLLIRFRNDLIKFNRMQLVFVEDVIPVGLSDRSKMLLHILYKTASKRYPNTEIPETLCSSIIVNAMYSLLLFCKENDKAQIIFRLHALGRGELSSHMYIRYKAKMRSFSQQPPFFNPVKKGQGFFEACNSLLNWASLQNNTPLFVNYINAYKSLSK